VGAERPEDAAREFLQAAMSGEYTAVYQRLTPSDQARLRELAQRATRQAGNRKRFAPEDMLGASIPTDLRYGLGRLEPVRQDGDRAEVRLVDARGKYHEIWRLQRHERRWRVVLDSLRAARAGRGAR
jgi:hypothetical protein